MDGFRSDGMPPAVILAGGLGTRLGHLVREVPKPLLPVDGKSVLQRQIERLHDNMVRDVLLIIGRGNRVIREHLADGSGMGVRVRYFEEPEPMGTGGALVRLRDRLPPEFLLLYGDLVFDVALEGLRRFHEAHGGACSIVVHPNGHPDDSDLVVLDSEHRVVGLIPKRAERHTPYDNRVNAGLFLMRRSILDTVRPADVLDLERDVLAPAIARGQVYGYRTTEYIRDMGTPERYALVQEHVRTGLVAKRNRSRPQKAIFLDRDGTLNEFVGLVATSGQLRVLDQAYEALKLINESEYLAIVITNQSVVARGLCSRDDLAAIHRWLETSLGRRGVYVDAIYTCPHHPDRGYPGEDVSYKVECACRKPRTALIDQATAAFNIDRGASYFVGDSTVDVQTGINAGLRTVLVETGEAGADGKHAATPNVRTTDVLTAARYILAATAGSNPFGRSAWH